MDLSGARMARKLHALADSLSEEIEKLDSVPLDSGDLDVAQQMAKTLESEIGKVAHKRCSTVAERQHQSLHYGPEGRIPIVPARARSSRPKRKKMGTPKEGSGKSSVLLVVCSYVRSYPYPFHLQSVICHCSCIQKVQMMMWSPAV